MSRDGEQWQQGGVTYTVNSAEDAKAEGGYYLSMKDNETGEKATAVYRPDNSLADTRANRDWK